MNLMNKFSFAIRGNGPTEMQEEEEYMEGMKENPSKINPASNEEAEIRELITAKAEHDEVSKENASLMKTVEELRSKIESEEALVCLKMELKSVKEKHNSLEKVLDELQMEIKCKEEKLNETNLMCKLYQDQPPIDGDNIEAAKAPQEFTRMKWSDDDAVLVALLEEELEESKDRIRNLQEMFDSMKAHKKQVSKKLSDITHNLNKIKQRDGEKLIELQKAYDRVNEEKDSSSQEIHTNRKIIDDQRHQLSMSVINLQEQKDVVFKKEMAKQNSIKTFKSEVDYKKGVLDDMRNCVKGLRENIDKSEGQAKRMIDDFGDDKHQVKVLQKKILELEQKLQISDANDKNKEIEEQKRVNLVNSQSTKLGELEYEAEQLKEKISEHMHELQLINTKHAEEDSISREKFSQLSLVHEEMKNKYNLNSEHVQVISDLENDLANTTYAKEAELEKKTREIIGEWRSKSFQCTKVHTKYMLGLENGKNSMSKICTIGVGLLAIFVGVVVLGKSMMN